MSSDFLKMKFAQFFPLFLFIFASYQVHSEEIIVSLPKGQIRGRTEVTFKNTTFYAFDEIPFAEPPVGQLRFKSPVPKKEWEGIWDCTKNTRICLQVGRNTSWPQSEDCLYLNVYTPVKPGSKELLSVMYYIYGGGFIHGSATFSIHPQNFIEKDVVIVSVNYRVGPFGFLSTEDEVITGNFGLKDQHLGLKWVQENIHLFGGDPTKVTIFGQSAGAASVTYQLLNKNSTGLFRGAIGQSGSAISPWAYQRFAKKIAFLLGNVIDKNITVDSPVEDLYSVLMNATADNINEAAYAIMRTENDIPKEQIVEGFFYAPVVEKDVEGAFITQKMYEQLIEGDFVDVPLVIGICSEENLGKAANLASFKTYMKDYEKDPARLANNNLGITDDSKRKEVGQVIRRIYTNDTFENNLAKAIQFFSDTSFARSVERFAELFSNSSSSNVYFYQFSYHGEMGHNKVYLDGAERVAHAEDNYYLWTQDSTIDSYPLKDQITLERYVTLFTDFAKTLNPTPYESELMQNITWTRFQYTEKSVLLDKSTQSTTISLPYLNINETLEILDLEVAGRRQEWEKIYLEFGRRPFDTY